MDTTFIIIATALVVLTAPFWIFLIAALGRAAYFVIGAATLFAIFVLLSL
jgi:hypothetical protein